MTLPPQISSYGGRMPQTQDNSRSRWVDRIYPEEFLRTLKVQGSGLTEGECNGNFFLQQLKNKNNKKTHLKKKKEKTSTAFNKF